MRYLAAGADMHLAKPITAEALYSALSAVLPGAQGRTVAGRRLGRQIGAVPYSFRPASPDDLPLLRRWLRAPEVVRWWGDPGEQYALLEEDLTNPLMAMRIVAREGRPFAYAQDYDVHSWPQPHFAALPAGARAIDAFVGEPDMIGRGHGSAFLRLLAQRLVAEGAPLVAIDPDVDNLRARKAYARAGFFGDRLVETGEGPAILMTFKG